MKSRTRSRLFSPTPEIINGYFPVQNTMVRVDTQCSAIWRKHCRCCKIRSQNRTARLQPPCAWTRHGTECVTIRASRNWQMPSHEPAELLRRAETAQRLQSRGGLRGCGVALDSGSIDSLSDLRSAAAAEE